MTGRKQDIKNKKTVSVIFVEGDADELIINRLLDFYRENGWRCHDDLEVKNTNGFPSESKMKKKLAQIQQTHNKIQVKFNENLLFEDNIKHDRTDEDLLFQAMIELGIELSAKIEKREIAGKTVWSVADNYLMACFDKDVNETTITEIARQHPYYFVLRDSSLATDNVADNFEQIWEEYSKDTIRRIL